MRAKKCLRLPLQQATRLSPVASLFSSKRPLAHHPTRRPTILYGRTPTSPYFTRPSPRSISTMVAKSCLKHSQSEAQTPNPSRLTATRPPLSDSRTVSFRDKTTDEVHQADDWDRTPVDVTPRLTYECVLSISFISRVCRLC